MPWCRASSVPRGMHPKSATFSSSHDGCVFITVCHDIVPVPRYPKNPPLIPDNYVQHCCNNSRSYSSPTVSNVCACADAAAHDGEGGHVARAGHRAPRPQARQHSVAPRAALVDTHRLWLRCRDWCAPPPGAPHHTSLLCSSHRWRRVQPYGSYSCAQCCTIPGGLLLFYLTSNKPPQQISNSSIHGYPAVERWPVLPVISQFSLRKTQKIVLNIRKFSMYAGTTGAGAGCRPLEAVVLGAMPPVTAVGPLIIVSQ